MSSVSITSASAPTSRSHAAVQDYSQGVQLVAAMLRGGFTSEEAGKTAGGNYMRIFRTAVG
jgi:membrane dipeptidase